LLEWKSKREMVSAEAGLRGSQQARKRLQNMQKGKEFSDEEYINKLIKNEKDALHAMNLHRLLTKSWAEYDNSYRIMSKLSHHDQARLKDILQDNRYT